MYSGFWQKQEFVERQSEKADAAHGGDFHSLLLSRRTVNDFEPSLPDGWEAAMMRAIEAATYAPNPSEPSRGAFTCSVQRRHGTCAS